MKNKTKDSISVWIFFIIVIICLVLLCEVCNSGGSSYTPDYEEDIRNERDHDGYWEIP